MSDLMGEFVILREAYDRAWDAARALSVSTSPELIDALQDRCGKRLAEVAHQAAKIRGMLVVSRQDADA